MRRTFASCFLAAVRYTKPPERSSGTPRSAKRWNARCTGKPQRRRQLKVEKREWPESDGCALQFLESGVRDQLVEIANGVRVVPRARNRVAAQPRSPQDFARPSPPGRDRPVRERVDAISQR